MAKLIPVPDRPIRERGATPVGVPQVGASRRYWQADALEILRVAGFGDGHGDMRIAAAHSPFGHNLIVIDETGVSPEKSLEVRSSLWKPCHELDDEPDAPDANVTPGLPFPFTAPQLAMFMLDGPGAMVNIAFGEWQSEPDADTLGSMGVNANRAREAVRAAFAAYHQAVAVVGMGHREPEALEAQARHSFKAAREAAHVKHNTHQSAGTRDEYWKRLELVNEELAPQSAQLELARKHSESARSLWRKAMVKELQRIYLAGIAPDEELQAVPDSQGSNVTGEFDGTSNPNQRRLSQLRELGGGVTRKDNRWKFTGIAKLVAHEKHMGHARSAEKTIRADLRLAADEEHEARRAGFATGLGAR